MKEEAVSSKCSNSFWSILMKLESELSEKKAIYWTSYWEWSISFRFWNNVKSLQMFSIRLMKKALFCQVLRKDRFRSDSWQKSISWNYYKRSKYVFCKKRPFRESIQYDARKQISKLMKLVTSNAIGEKVVLVYSLETVQCRPINCETHFSKILKIRFDWRFPETFGESRLPQIVGNGPFYWYNSVSTNYFRLVYGKGYTYCLKSCNFVKNFCKLL